MMKTAILGNGHVGSWLAAILSKDHEVMVYEPDAAKRSGSAKHYAASVAEIKGFGPELLINAADHENTIAAFDSVAADLPKGCVLADVAAVKSGLADYYAASKRPFVSLHPMFRPQSETASKGEYAIIINESDPKVAALFRGIFESLGIRVFGYSFEEHDSMIAYTLAVPFISSMVFASSTKFTEAPGTTYNRHLDITRSLMAEDDYVLAEILFNPGALEEIEKISSKLSYLTHIIRARDYEEVHHFFDNLRKNISGGAK